MKTVTIHAAKDLRIEECPEPECGPNNVLVQVEAGGICGSDLHYFNHGGFGTVRLREPMILGHEVSGKIKGCRGAGDGPYAGPARCGLPLTALWRVQVLSQR